MGQRVNIGVFDSGLGGLSVFRHLITDLPNAQLIYVADSAYCPYGTRTFEQIQQRTKKIVDFLIETYSVSLVVVACNTATAAAIDFLRSTYTIPFVGIEPAIKPAALKTLSKVIGVLATEGTFNGRLFKQTTERYTNGIKTIIQPGYGLVELVEKGIVAGPEVENLLNQYISPMVEQGADILVLGCTHYPFLSNTIGKLFPNLILIDPAPAVSLRAKTILQEMRLPVNLPSENPIFLTTGDSATMDDFLSMHLSIKAKSKQIKI